MSSYATFQLSRAQIDSMHLDAMKRMRIAKEVLVKKRNLRKLKSIHVLFPKKKATNSKITFIVLLVKFVKDCMYLYALHVVPTKQSANPCRRAAGLCT